jgi:hypothetical protein
VIADLSVVARHKRLQNESGNGKLQNARAIVHQRSAPQHPPPAVQDNIVINVLQPRRRFLVSAAFALGGTAAAVATSGGAPSRAPQKGGNEKIVRRYYAAWEQKDWAPFDAVLAEDFTFTSANDDDHISKAAFKDQCWKTQVDFIERFDIERLLSQDNEAFVKYLCHTRNGKTFRNVELLTIGSGKLQSIECYFGAKSSFASAVSTGKSL